MALGEAKQLWYYRPIKQNLGYEERLKYLEIEDYLSNIYKFIFSDLREMEQGEL